MGFSKEWENMYQTGAHNSIWPWSEVITLTKRYLRDLDEIRVLELGCGAGANIPFFVAENMRYYGIEGSKTEVTKINQRFQDDAVTVVEGDFTKEIPFEGAFDLILDRSSMTHNATEDIRSGIELVRRTLKPGGYYFGLDWFSTKYDVYANGQEDCDVVDENTRFFRTGYFAGLGNVHFSDPQHILKLFEDFEMIELYEKVDTWEIPKGTCSAALSFVAKKKSE